MLKKQTYLYGSSTVRPTIPVITNYFLTNFHEYPHLAADLPNTILNHFR